MKLFAKKRLTEAIDPHKVTNIKTYLKLLEQEIQSLNKRKVFVDALANKPQTLADELNKVIYKITKVAIDSTKIKIMTLPTSGHEFPIIVVEIGNKLVDEDGVLQNDVEASVKFTFGGLKCDAKQKNKRIVIWTELDRLSASEVDDNL